MPIQKKIQCLYGLPWFSLFFSEFSLVIKLNLKGKKTDKENWSKPWHKFLFLPCNIYVIVIEILSLHLVHAKKLWDFFCHLLGTNATQLQMCGPCSHLVWVSLGQWIPTQVKACTIKYQISLLIPPHRGFSGSITNKKCTVVHLVVVLIIFKTSCPTKL